MTDLQFKLDVLSRMTLADLWYMRYDGGVSDRLLALRELRRRGYWFGYRQCVLRKLHP